MIAYHLYVSGWVQGVCFRAYTRDAARELGVRGWVRNLPDGNVEAVIEGKSETVSAMVAWLRRGSPMSRVDSVQVYEEPPTGEFADFDVTFGRRGWR